MVTAFGSSLSCWKPATNSPMMRNIRHAFWSVLDIDPYPVVVRQPAEGASSGRDAARNWGSIPRVHSFWLLASRLSAVRHPLPLLAPLQRGVQRLHVRLAHARQRV